MRTSFEGASGLTGDYFALAVVERPEIATLGGDSGIEEIARQACVEGKKHCKRVGECALEALVRKADNGEQVIDVECGIRTGCSETNSGPVSAALVSIEIDAGARGVIPVPIDLW